MRPKVKFLVAVWGETYVGQFTALALPSFLAPGNLPSLAKVTDLEVIIMTSADSVLFFNQKPSFQQLGRVCEVRFIEIDDLITNGAYGVTLTLAYARGVMESGDDMVNTHFVFMNSDFVLADGSLRNMLQHVLDGRAIIVAPSFRVVAENVESQLLSRVNSYTSALTIPPRELVELAFSHMHPTTVAKIVNQNLCHSITPNQFFWQVDEKTMVGRFYLIFMLCLKPERVITTVNSYCDYGFIPEMCPSGDMVVMTDSDQFFMLELSKRVQEGNLLRPGSQSIAEVGHSLSAWTTAEHRRAAEYKLLFHAGDVPPQSNVFAAEADRFLAKVGRRLSKPIPHAHHYYWVLGVDGWRRSRRNQQLPDQPIEIDCDIPIAGFAIQSLNWLHFLVFGIHPYVRFWHYNWCDYKPLRRQLRRILSQSDARILFLEDGLDTANHVFPSKDSRIAKFNIRDIPKLSDHSPATPCQQFTHVVCYLSALPSTELIEYLQSHMAMDSEILVFVDNTRSNITYSDFCVQISDYVAHTPAALINSLALSFSGGLLKFIISHSVDQLRSTFYRHGLKSLVIVAPALAILFTVSALNNLYQVMSRRDNKSFGYVSTILMRRKV